MDTGAKAKVGIAATGGILAALVGLGDDCLRLGTKSARFGDEAASLGSGGDDLVRFGNAGDDLAGIGPRTLEDLAGSPAEVARIGGADEVTALRASTWQEFASRGDNVGPGSVGHLAQETALDAAGYGLDVAGLLLENEGTPTTNDRTPDPVGHVQGETMTGPAVAAILPLPEQAGERERALRTSLETRGVFLLDTPQSFDNVLDLGPRPLFLIARGVRDGVIEAPDGSELEAQDLLRRCRDAGTDCVALICEESARPAPRSTHCLQTAHSIVPLDHEAGDLAALLRELLQRREVEHANTLVIQRLAGDPPQPIFSRVGP